MSNLPAQPIISGTPDFAALNNQRRSPLLKLPAELRNVIFAYAFQEHCILVRRLACDKLSFRVKPHDFPSTNRYPLSDLLARAKTCRQIYQETAGLVMRLNIFRFDHIDCIDLIVERLYPWKLGSVKSVIFGMPCTPPLMCELLSSDLKRLVNLKHVFIDTKSWLAHQRSNERIRERSALTLMACIGEFLDVEFV